MFVRNFNTTLAASGTLEADTKVEYLCTLVYREALRHFNLLSAYVESTKTFNIEDIVKGLAQYTPPVNKLSKQKHAMCCGMKTMLRYL